ncbi:transcriptional regulator GcvA [Govanella unica]|uniref:Transcriptional regulator GcvA n=1 Tax=Govanella unica TaxID=2975056 RepID=A0A9X3Z7A8_9PROT|nr:transcriptional regulator GcvA [Govania unica]MDA5193878.1 transcriptional regulator GcvA [Govania unica]
MSQTPINPRRLPPLNAIRAFEAAARHRSFTRAGEELFVTQGAVSHQVKQLEEWFGFPLFDRHKREVFLTEKGEVYLPFIRGMLNELYAVTQTLMDKGSEQLLCVSAAESFMVNWMINRLKGFSETHPDINIRVTSQNQVDDLGNIVGEEGVHWVDLRIRYGRGKWPGLEVTKLFDEDIFPVCHPELITSGKPLRDLNDLKHHTLIHDDMQMSWSNWLSAAGSAQTISPQGPRFSHSHMAIQAALNGHGIALGRSVLVLDLVRKGQLIRPFPLTVPSQHAYYLLCQERSINKPKIKTFKNWLLSEAKNFISQDDLTLQET